jgi:hypothetical protein
MAKAAEGAPTGTAILSVQERIAARLANVDKSTQAPTSKRISVKGSKFTLPDGKTSDGPLNCVIVDYINTNAFYPGAYNPNDIQPPVCSAVGRDLETMGPVESATSVSTHCKGCPNNEFGSAGRGKACGNAITLALLPEGYDGTSELLTIKVSATGISGWSSYVRSLAGQGVDPMQVVTSIDFKPGVTYPSLIFKSIGGNESLDIAGQFMTVADSMLNAAT